MARLAFFTERLPSSDRALSVEITGFSYDLMTSLADQQHDVRVFSTYRETDTLPISHARLQIVRPFRSWSWLEIPRLIPILLDFQPEILHFIQPKKEAFSGLTNAMTALPSLAPLIGKPRIVVSLYDVRKSELQRSKNLLQVADVIVVANHQQADEVSQWLVLNKKVDQSALPLIEVVTLPGPEIFDSSIEIESMPGLDQLKTRAQNLILVPGDLDQQCDLASVGSTLNQLLTTSPDVGLIFGGGWGEVSLQARRSFLRQFEDEGNGSRLLLTGPLSFAAEATALKASKLVLLAGLAHASLSLARWIRLSLHAARPLVLSEEQSQLDPLTWRHQQNAFIVTEDPNQWGATLADAISNDSLRREIQDRLPDFARSEAVDRPSNAMSRIYSQVLRTPRKPLR